MNEVTVTNFIHIQSPSVLNCERGQVPAANQMQRNEFNWPILPLLCKRCARFQFVGILSINNEHFNDPNKNQRSLLDQENKLNQFY
jgi:hypothetical protein